MQIIKDQVIKKKEERLRRQKGWKSGEMGEGVGEGWVLLFPDIFYLNIEQIF